MKVSLKEPPPVIGVLANNKDILIQEVDKQIKTYPEYIVPYAPYLSIEMPCEQKIVFRTREDIPDKTLVCTCGSPNHFFIQYTDEK